MKRNELSLKNYLLGLVAAAAVIAGCNSPAGPGGSGTWLSNSTSSVHRADVETTTYKVEIKGPVFGNFHGTYTPEPCWTVSPSPLDNYPISHKIWVNYVTGCSTRTQIVTYTSGYGSDAQPCNFAIHYPAGGPFQYSIGKSSAMCAVATAPPSKDYDETLIYEAFYTPAPR
jgi:hypothetical protein